MGIDADLFHRLVSYSMGAFIFHFIIEKVFLLIKYSKQFYSVASILLCSPIYFAFPDEISS